MPRRPLVWAALALLALQAWRNLSWTSDDAFISLRYAQRLAEGRGLTFNDSERTEGFTNPLWTVTLGGLIRLGIAPLPAMKGLGLALAALALLLCARLEARLGAGRWAGLGALWLSAHPAFVSYAVGGMENPMLAAALLAAWLRLEADEGAGRPPGVLSGLLFATAALVRTDAALAFAAVLAAALLRDRRPRRLLGFCAAFAVPVVLASLLRAGYYGSATPCTYLVKATGPLAGRLDWGIGYMGELVGAHLNALLLATAALAPLAIPARALGAASAALFGGLSLVYWVWVGGDRSFDAFRPMATIAAVLAPFSARGAVEAASRLSGRLRPLAAASALLVLCGFQLRQTEYRFGVLRAQKAGPGTSGRTLTDFPGHMAMYPAIADWLKAHAEPGAVLVFDEVGYIPWASGLTTVDPIGLTDRFLAELYAANRYASYYHGWLSPETIRGVHLKARDYLLDTRRADFILYAVEGGALTAHPAMAALKDDPRFRARYEEAASFDWKGIPRFRMFRRKP